MHTIYKFQARLESSNDISMEKQQPPPKYDEISPNVDHSGNGNDMYVPPPGPPPSMPMPTPVPPAAFARPRMQSVSSLGSNSGNNSPDENVPQQDNKKKSSNGPIWLIIGAMVLAIFIILIVHFARHRGPKVSRQETTPRYDTYSTTPRYDTYYTDPRPRTRTSDHSFLDWLFPW